MPQELSSIVEQIWRSGSSLAEALRLSQDLPPTAQQQLLSKFESMADFPFAEKTKAVSAETGSSEPTTNSVEPNSDVLARLLLLLVFGIYHSDSLVYLPPEMRKERLTDWANATNFDFEVVKRVAILGPAGLGVLVGKN